MNITYWPVGAANHAHRALATTPDDISRHLLMDWMPGQPLAHASTFIGWPKTLVLPYTTSQKQWLTLATEAGWMERQWKGVMSWMLGVAGARHVLEDEGYRWVAPTSAFYEEAKQKVSTQTKGAPFTATWLEITAKKKAVAKSTISGAGAAATVTAATAAATAPLTVNERPDFIAARPLKVGGCELAIAESKGTSAALEPMQQCDPVWYEQAHNAVVKRIDLDRPVPIPRHMVIATRVNPNAKRDETRALQIRAWNSNKQEDEAPIPREAMIDIVGAHLYGMFRNLDMFQSAIAIVDSVQATAPPRPGRPQRTPKERRETADRARDEVTSLRRAPSLRGSYRGDVLQRDIGAEALGGTVELNESVAELSTSFFGNEDPLRALSAIKRAEERLDEEGARERSARPTDRSASWTTSGVSLVMRER